MEGNAQFLVNEFHWNNVILTSLRKIVDRFFQILSFPERSTQESEIRMILVRICGTRCADEHLNVIWENPWIIKQAMMNSQTNWLDKEL